MEWSTLKLFSMLFIHFCSGGRSEGESRVTTHEDRYHASTNSTAVLVTSALQCSHKCLRSDNRCLGANFRTEMENGKYQCELLHRFDVMDGLRAQNGWDFLVLLDAQKTNVPQANPPVDLSCKEIKEIVPAAADGVYWLNVGGQTFQAYCDMTNGGFTLIARYSNADAKNWMQASGEFWYTKQEYGNATSTEENADMISLPFSLVNGSDIKVSRSDDNAHTALLLASGCLQGATMRAKITSYGDFRNGKVWTSEDECHGNCSAVFSGQYASTDGFKYATSSCATSNDILDGYNIGFWCRYDSGDGSVIMFGGGGKSCGRADHGIGITEENSPKFGGTRPFFDFGSDAGPGRTTAYALNLWIR